MAFAKRILTIVGEALSALTIKLRMPTLKRNAPAVLAITNAAPLAVAAFISTSRIIGKNRAIDPIEQAIKAAKVRNCF